VDCPDIDDHGRPWADPEPFQLKKTKEEPDMGYYVSLEIQVKTRKTAAAIRAILENCAVINAAEAKISGKGAYRFFSYQTSDFKLGRESEAALLLAGLELEPMHKPNNGRQTPNLGFVDDLECRCWGYTISHGYIQPMRTVWDYDTEAKAPDRTALLATLLPLKTVAE